MNLRIPPHAMSISTQMRHCTAQIITTANINNLEAIKIRATFEQVRKFSPLETICIIVQIMENPFR